MMMTANDAPAATVHETTSSHRVTQWLDLIQAEYREMPCLSLTKPQVQRLWGLDSVICDALLDALVRARVLRRTLGGNYVAADSGH